MIRSVALVAAAYLLGSIPTGLWLGKAVAGIDVRLTGSRRMGATNVQRSLGTRAAIAVLVLDLGKGFLAVALTRAITGNDYVAAAAGLGAIVGHIWPLFAGFHGGRGVATGAGAALAMAPLPLVLAGMTLVVVVAATRYVSLGSIIGALSLPAWILLLHGLTPESPSVLPWSVVVAALLVLRHADNVQRLLRGTENKFVNRG